MPKPTLAHLARRVAILGATIAVVAVGAGTVQVAADWRVAEAPMDAVPVSLADVEDELVAERARAAGLEAQLLGVAGHVADLRSALITAGLAVDGGIGDAERLDDRLEAARDRLRTIQRQLRGAQARLEALNRAAERQAALNTQATSTTGAAGRPEDRDDGDEDEDDD